MLSSNGQDSFLVLQLILNYIELAIQVLIFKSCATRELVKDFMLDVFAVLVQFKLANWLHMFILESYAYKLILRDDLLSTIFILF